MPIMGLDIGSTGCKAMAFAEEGRPLGYAYREYPKAAGETSLDARVLWQAVEEVVQEVAATTPGIRALSVSSFGESFVPVDRQGQPLCPIVMYTDDRALAQCGRLEEAFAQGGYASTVGAWPHVMYSLPKMAHLVQEQPGLAAQVWKYLLVEDYVLYRLTGEAVTDYSMAARTMAFDVKRHAWADEVLALSGVEAARMAQPLPSGAAVGPILPDRAGRLGLPQDCLVVTGGHDQVCAAVGAGVLAGGRAVNGMGTVECVTPVFDHPVLEEAFLRQHYVCVPHAQPGKYVTYAFSFSGGAILTWFRDAFMRHRKAEAQAAGVSLYTLLEREAPQEPTQLVVIPHFAGSGTPDMRTTHRGGVLGLTLGTSSGDLYRALMEGVAYEMAYNLDCLARQGVTVGRLDAVGGGARSRMWLHIKADLTGLPVVPLQVEEAGLTGTAMLAATALGEYRDLPQAAAAFVREQEPILPDPHRHEQYQAGYARFAEARAWMTRQETDRARAL